MLIFWSLCYQDGDQKYPRPLSCATSPASSRPDSPRSVFDEDDNDSEAEVEELGMNKT